MIINTPDRVTRVTIVSNSADQSAFTMIFSMSHTAVDGHSYFSILNMLSAGADIKTLSPVRETKVAECVDAAWKEDKALTTSCTFILKVMCALICEPKNKYYAHLVDPAKVKSAKEAAVKRGAKF